MTPLRLCVVGVGHLGKEHARILSAMADVELVGVVDVNATQAETIAARCHTRAFTDYRALLTQTDAAVIVVPTIHHFATASDFLRRGIPVLVEKPLAPMLSQAQDLLSQAERQRVVLQVGHIERFNPAFEELQKHPLQPIHVACERCGPFSGRSTDIGAILDLMIHDLDLLLTLVKSPVVRVEALGRALLGGHEDLARARLVFANGCVADLNVSRISAAPSRRMQIWAVEGFAEIDFAARRLTLTRPTEELQRLQKGRRPDPATWARLPQELHGKYLEVTCLDCTAPADQLTRELQDFVHCVRTGDRPRVAGEDGRDAVALAGRILEAINLTSGIGTSRAA